MDRGGLFHISDTVFFFWQLEEKSRPYVSKAFINQNHNVDLKITQIWTSQLGFNQNSWDFNITRDFEEQEILLSKVVNIFNDIRTGTYVKAVT